ncbi:MAG TPA: hypothetical protein VMF66_07000 [Candidatus Acidoferrum sp.]|nr:hypothetical protein [Candidatus Acidoferrum sp.]
MRTTTPLVTKLVATILGFMMVVIAIAIDVKKSLSTLREAFHLLRVLWTPAEALSSFERPSAATAPSSGYAATPAITNVPCGTPRAHPRHAA